MLVIARAREEGEVRAVRVPVDVGQLAIAAIEVVAARGAMLVLWHLEPHDVRRCAADVDDHALDHGHDAVAYQRVLPRFERRMTDLRSDEVHLADATLILLKRRNLPRVRRPGQD